MDYQVYSLLQEAYEIVAANEGRSMSSIDQATVKAILHSTLKLYADSAPAQTSPPAGAIDGLGEARRPPVHAPKPQKLKWYQKLLG